MNDLDSEVTEWIWLSLSANLLERGQESTQEKLLMFIIMRQKFCSKNRCVQFWSKMAMWEDPELPNSAPMYEAVPPEELRADLPASVQQKTDHRQNSKRDGDTVMKGTLTPDAASCHGEGWF